VVCDPRTQIAESLQAVLAAELVDSEGWELLLQLARALGQDEIAASFAQAADEERMHLVRVRAWVAGMVMHEAGVEEPRVPTPPAA